MIAAAQRGGFIREVDGLRGIAILAVMFHHFWPETGPLARLGNVVHLGWMGVDLFFVISGFLIGGILLDTKGGSHYYRNFYARRAIRIFPLYYLFITVAFTVIPAVQAGRYFETEFVRSSGSPVWYFFYLANVPEALTGIEPAFILAPLWSLAIEEQFYATFPLVVARLRRATLAKALIGAILFSIVFRVVTALAIPWNERVQYLATPSRLEELALGGLLAIGARSPAFRVTKRQASIALAVATAAFIGLVVAGGAERTSFFGRTLGYSVVGLAFTALVLWTVSFRDEPETTALGFAPLAYVGKLCYGLYILHRPASIVFLKLLERLDIEVDDESIAIVLVKLAASLLAATASWYAFERPLLKLKSRFSSERHPAGRGRVEPRAIPLPGPSRAG